MHSSRKMRLNGVKRSGEGNLQVFCKPESLSSMILCYQGAVLADGSCITGGWA